MQRSVLIGSALLFLVAGFGLDHSAHGASVHFRVHVNVSGGDEIKDRIASCVNRQLRSLGDVDLVDTNPEYELGVVALSTRSKGGQHTGYAIATNALLRFANGNWEDELKPEWKKIWEQTTSALYFYPQSWIAVGADLDELCKDTVATFDAQTLESARKFRQQMQDILKEK